MAKKKSKGEPTKVNDLKKELETDIHSAPLTEILKRFDTDIKKGLPHDEAKKRFLENGPNELTPPKQIPIWLKFISVFKDGFSIMLTVGGVLCFAAYGIAISSDPETPKDNLYLGAVLIIVVLITGIFSFYQESKSSKIMDSFKKLIPQESMVIRSSEKTLLPAREVVLGDIVLLKSGDFIPADIRIIESKGFKVDNSSLTGESEPQKRYPECTNENLLETANFLIAFTYGVEGTAVGVVVQTGDDTVMGRIASLTSSLKQGKTPIAIEISRFIKIITFIAIFLGALFFILGMTVSKLSFVNAVVFLIGIIVANVPEGLLVTVTLSLTLTAQKMASKSCLVKNLESVETLGSTGVICSDKTGTLTQNKMLVAHYWCNLSKLNSEVSTNEANTRMHSSCEQEVHANLARIAAICNRAEFLPNQEETLSINNLRTSGDASESALIKYIETHVGFLIDIREQHPKLFEIPFNSVNKYQLSIHKTPYQEPHLLVIKGAPERILERCSKILLTRKRALEMNLISEQQADLQTSKPASLLDLGEEQAGTDMSTFQAETSAVDRSKQPINVSIGGINFTARTEKKLDASKLNISNITDSEESAIEIILTEDIINKIKTANEDLASLGERVLGFAQKWLPIEKFPDNCNFVDSEEKPLFEIDQFTFVGLFALIDPPRDAVPEAVRECKSAGIRVVMVTGDHPTTAKAIARNVGIIDEENETIEDIAKRQQIASAQVDASQAKAIVVTGTQLKDMSHDQLDYIICNHTDIVFARTSPQQKLLIVEGFQRQGYVVAVTGDGVNDSPALRKADIGVAMGIAGSDVAKQAADMILLNDNFANIVIGVKEGRLIFDNLKKSIAYTLTSNIPEILPFLIHIIAGIPLPLGTITILLIDLGTDMVPAISLAYEGPELDIMKRRPRNPKKDRLVNQVLINYSYPLVGVWQALNGFLVYLFIMLMNGFFWNELLHSEPSWSNRNVPYILDSFGQQWSYVARKNVEFTCQSAYFLATVLIQIADLLISKTRRQSIFVQGLWSNKFMLFAIFFEVALACFLVYTPPLNVGLNTRLVWPFYTIFAILNAILLWACDEIRRFVMRRHPQGFIERETYY